VARGYDFVTMLLRLLVVGLVVVAAAMLFPSRHPRAGLSRPSALPASRPRALPAAPAPEVKTLVVATPEVRRTYRVLDDDGTRVEGATVVEGAEGRLYVWRPGRRKAANPPPDVIAQHEPITLPAPSGEEEPNPGALRGRVLTGDGVPAACARVRMWSRNGFVWLLKTTVDEQGDFEIVRILPGTYTVELHLDGQPTLFLHKVVVEEGATRDLDVVRLPLPGRIEIRAEDEPSVRSRDQDVRYRVHERDGVWISEDLVPGRYLVTRGVGDYREIEVFVGGAVQVELLTQDVFAVTFIVDVRCRLETEAGHLVADERLEEKMLVAGRYRLVHGDAVEEFVVSGATSVRATFRRVR